MVPLVGACAGAKLFEHEPRPQEHTKKRTHLAGLRFEPPKRRIEKNTPEGVFFSMVPLVGLEPTRYRYHWILSPARLPISPQRLIEPITL